MATRPPLAGTVLITGASSGIGRAIARSLSAEARRLVLVARRRERLQDLADELSATRPGLRVDVRPCDLADLRAVQELAREFSGEENGVDVLVNNAGFGDRAFVEEADWPRLEQMIAVNVTAVTALTRLFVPSMVQRGHGGVLNISSVLGTMYVPSMATYVGSKHYVNGFTHALRAELAGTGVVVTLACPGPVDTEFAEVATTKKSSDSPEFLRIDASECALEVLQGFRRGRAVVFPGFGSRWMAWLFSLLPAALVRWGMERLGARKR